MNNFQATTLALAVAALPLLSACSQPASGGGTTADVEARAPSETADAGAISGAIHKELEKARKELHEENIAIGGKGVNVSINGTEYAGDPDDGRPRAEISPEGDLLIDGKPVGIDAGQRAQLLEYRREVVEIAEAGIAIGGKGVGLAESALRQAAGAIFTGKTDDMERSIEAEAMKLKAEAQVLCTKLPAMLATQQQLAASLPEFRPYATMTQADIDDCLKDTDEEGEGAWSTQ